MPTQARVVCVGDVAGGEDVGIGRTQVLVDDDSVVDLETGRCSEFGARNGADANDDHVGVDCAPVTQNETGHGPVPAGQFGCRGPVAEVHTVAAVQVVKDGRYLWAEDTLQR